MDSEVVDVDGMHDPSTNNSRVNILTAGRYLAVLRGLVDADATSYREFILRKSGSTTVAGRIERPNNASLTFGSSLAALLDLAVNDYIEAGFRQESGSDLNVLAVSNQSPYLLVSMIDGTQYCFVYNNADLTITSGATWSWLTFNTEDSDTDSMHSTVSNTSRITINTAGLYAIFGQIQWASNSSGYRGLQIRVNGDDNKISGGHTAWPQIAMAWNQQIFTTLELAVNDYLELGVRQSSGGDLAVSYIAGLSPYFSVVRID